MFEFLSRLGGRRRRKPKAVPPKRSTVRPRLEVLEDRTAPAAWAFIGGQPNNPASWYAQNSWVVLPTEPPPPVGQTLPGPQDLINIGDPLTGQAGYCIIPSGTVNVAQAIVTGNDASSLTVNGELDVAQNGSPFPRTGGISSQVGGVLTDNGTISVSGGPDQLAGSTTITGAFNNQGNAYEVMTGAGLIGPGGHLDDYGDAQFIVANPASTPLTIASGGYLDQLSAGPINISGNVSVMGSQPYWAGNIDLTPSFTISSTTITPGGFTTPGAYLGGSGSILDQGVVNWSGGAIALGGGFDIGGGADFQTSGSAPKSIQTTLTNDNASTTFGGTGPIQVGNPGVASGILNNDQPGSTLNLDTSVTVMPGWGSFANDGILNVNDPNGTVSLNNLTSDASTSQIDVSAGTTLALTGYDTLGGTLNNNNATVLVPGSASGLAADVIDAALTQNLFGQDTGLFLVNGQLIVTPTGSATFNGPLQVMGDGANLTANGPLTVYDLTVGTTFGLTGTAAVTNSGDTTIVTAGSASLGGLLTNDGNLKVDGGLNASGGLTNNLSVLVGGGATVGGELENNDTLEVQAGGNLAASGELDNASGGSLSVDAASGGLPAGVLAVGSGGSLVNSGTVADAGTAFLAGTLNNGGTVEVTSAGSWTDGTDVDNSGVLKLDNGSLFSETAGTLSNTGTLELGPGNSATVSNLVQNGDLQVDVSAATSYGRLGVSNLLTLTTAPDTLDMNLEGGYQPPSGTAFQVLTFGSLSGTFADVENSSSWSVDYNTNNVTVVAQ
jgi:fibronectin-binding autotransporter adhesin